MVPGATAHTSASASCYSDVLAGLGHSQRPLFHPCAALTCGTSAPHGRCPRAGSAPRPAAAGTATARSVPAGGQHSISSAADPPLSGPPQALGKGPMDCWFHLKGEAGTQTLFSFQPSEVSTLVHNPSTSAGGQTSPELEPHPTACTLHT